MPVTETNRRHRLVGTAAGIGLVLSWSSGFIGADLGTRHATADTLLVWRYLAAAAVLGLLAMVSGRWPRSRRVARHGVVGLLTQGLYLGGVVTGVALGVPAGTAALVAALQPLVVSSLAGPVLGERVTRAGRVGLVLGLGGVALVVSGDIRTGDAPAWAYLLPAAGMLALSVGTVLDRHWDLDDGLLGALTAQTVVVAVAMVVAAGAGGGLTPPREPDFWWAVAWVVVLSSFGGYGCYFLVLRLHGANRVSALLYLTPPTTMLWAAMMFGDRPGSMAVLGTAVCAGAVALALRAESPQERDIETDGAATSFSSSARSGRSRCSTSSPDRT